MSRGGRAAVGALVLAALAAGCAAGGSVAPGPRLITPTTTTPTTTTPTTTTPTVRLPPEGARFDYQLGGAYPPPSGVTVVARDSTAEPAVGTYGICYVNGFQTQPDRSAWWLSEHPDLVLRDASGQPVTDPGWPDEYLLDTSSAARRAAIAQVLAPVVTGCARHGFAAVELDNLDSWTRSGGRLTADDALDLAARLVDVAHSAGLATAQKNAVEIARRGRAIGFDFAVAEECQRYDECAAYTEVYGAHVLDVEYLDDLRGTWADVCADPSTPVSVILRDRELVSPDDPSYTYRHC